MHGAPTRAEVSEGASAAWWQRTSPLRLTLLAIGAGLCVLALLTIPDELAVRYPRWTPSMLIVDLAVAAFCGILLAKTLRDARRRHRQMVQRLRMIAEMNHHIRNALEQIQMSAHTSRDQQLIDNLQTATARIQWALREVLPQEGDAEQS